MSGKPGKLTAKQERFVREYLKDLNAKQAAIRSGYSPKTAEQQGCRLLSYAKVTEAVEKGKARLAQKAEINAEYVLNGLRGLAEEGEQTGPRVRAYELLGKHLDLFGERALRVQVDVALGRIRDALRRHLAPEILEQVLADICGESPSSDGEDDAGGPS